MPAPQMQEDAVLLLPKDDPAPSRTRPRQRKSSQPSPCITHPPAAAMEHQSAAQARPGYDDHHPYMQQDAEDRGNGGWDPIAPTPDLDLGSPASPEQRSKVSFAPVSPPTSHGADTPSSAGLGIGSMDHAAQFPGYYPVVTRDSFQQDSPPKTPPAVVNDSSKSIITPQEYPINSPDGPPYYYPFPNPYDGSSPPSDPGGPRFARLRESTGWKMVTGGWPMYGMFLLGFGFAVGHHAFYNHLDGRPADDQIRMMRFGGLLSYAAKASLVAAVIYAYRQQIWVTAINNTMRLRTIDSLFAAVNEPLALWNWEFLKKARIAACLAVLAWLFPLTVILTPATLTVAPHTEAMEDRCHGIRTLNFEGEKDKNWRTAEWIDGYRLRSLSFWNSTLHNSSTVIDTPFNETFVDYFTSPSTQVELVAAQSALTGSVIPRPNVASETCGTGWNCSYTISFKAPGYKCAELARGEMDEDDIHRQGAPGTFHPGNLIPNGEYSYVADTDTGDYSAKQMGTMLDGGAPDMEPPYPKHLGAFRMEPVLWIGHSQPKKHGTLPQNDKDPGWDEAFEAVVHRCEHYIVDYTVQFNHSFSEQATTVLKREYLHPVVDTTWVKGKNAEDGTNDNTTATPESNYVLPIDFEKYRVTAAYHAMGKGLRHYINGYIKYAPFPSPLSEATKTPLIDPETFLPVPDFIPSIQQFYENMTLSLLSNPQFLVVSWAADPSRRSGRSSTTDPALSYPCTKTRIANAYVYNKRDLWIAYAAAISAAVFAVVLGSAALSQNNFHVRDAHVSSIVAATRAPCLEGLPWKASKWGEVPPEIMETRLGYGVIAENGPNGTPATMGMWMGGVGSPRVMGGKVYYGFAPREVLERTRVATFGPGLAGGTGGGKLKSRLSAFSFRTWEQGYR